MKTGNSLMTGSFLRRRIDMEDTFELKDLTDVNEAADAPAPDGEQEASGEEETVRAAKTSSGRKTSSSKTGSSKKGSSAKKKTTSSTTLRLSATEKRLVQYYRDADTDTRKAAYNLLKTGKTELGQFLGKILDEEKADQLSDLLTGALQMLNKN